MERVVEEQLARAAADGELVPEPLKGRPIPSIDERRPDGWWANSFVRRERSHDRRESAVAEGARARARFWQAGDEAEVRSLVARANDRITATNVDLIEPDRLDLFDVDDVVRRWSDLSLRGR